MSSPTEISVAQLSRLIGTPNAPAIIDLRIDEDFDADPQFVPTATRHLFTDVDSLVPLFEDQSRSLVVYCQKGKKISQGAVAILRDGGIAAESLQGGHFAWRDAGQPLVPAARLPTPNAQGRSVWVSKQRPKIDRIACPWLIRRFVDPKAQFLYVAQNEVLDVAQKYGATSFDVDDADWGHKGELCTFDAMLAGFDLNTPALHHLATIIRGADTNQLDLAPESAGLLAASLGLSRMYRDDSAQLNAGMTLYDAFYLWARDATKESHDSGSE